MRRLRRLTAAIAHLLVIQLALVSGTPGCAVAADGAAAATPTVVRPDSHPAHHAGAAGMTTMPAAGGAAHASTHHAPPHPSHHHGGSHCELSCAPSGCTSDGHCASDAALRPSPTSPRLLDAAGRRARARADVPASVSTAPEPPPPRA